jgi:hypothetical protein
MDDTRDIGFFLMFLALYVVAWFRHGPPNKRGDVGVDGSAGSGSGGGAGDSGGGFGGDCGGGSSGDGGACGGGYRRMGKGRWLPA